MHHNLKNTNNKHFRLNKYSGGHENAQSEIKKIMILTTLNRLQKRSKQ